MAQTFDAKNSFRNTTAGTTSTWSHTVGSGADVLVVFSYRANATAGVVSGVTYGGVALAFAGESSGGGTAAAITAWYLLNPASGTANVVATHASLNTIRFHSASFFADGALTFDQMVSEIVTATENPMSLSVTPAASSALCVDGAFYQTTGGFTAATGTDQVELYRVAEASAFSTGSSYKLNQSASATTFSWTKPASTVDTNQVILVFSEATSIPLAATEEMAFTDATNLTAPKPLQATDTSAFTDAAVLLAPKPLVATEAMAFTDAAVLAVAKPLQATEPIAFTDAADLRIAKALQATDTSAFTDVAALAVAKPLQATELVAFTDSATLADPSFFSATQSIAFTDAAALAIPKPMQATEALAFTDAAALLVAKPLQATDASSFTDMATLIAPKPLQATEALAFTDVAALMSPKPLVATEAIAFTDSAAFAVPKPLQAVEMLAFTDVADLAAEQALAATGAFAFDASADLGFCGRTIRSRVAFGGRTPFTGRAIVGSRQPVATIGTRHTEVEVKVG